MPDAIDTKNHPAVKALAAHQERLSLTNVRIAKRYLRCSDSTWSLLKSGTYPGDTTTWIEKVEAALRLIEDEEVDHGENSELLSLSDARAAAIAVRRCANEPRNRLVSFLANTGGGKTMLARKLRADLGATVVSIEATEVWRDNYFAALLAIAEALGLSDELGNVRAAEASVIDALAMSPRILAIDEAHYSGRAALNLIKLVLNRSQSRVLLLAMPELWARMQRKSWEETQQLRNRTYSKIVLTNINAEDCRLFLEAKMKGFGGVKEAEKTIIAQCRDSANRFGLFNTLQTICTEVNSEAAGKPVDGDLVEAAIKRVEALRS